MNQVVLIGRLTKDPELRYTPNGVAVANFTLAVNRTFTNQQGEREADFIMIQVWQKLAENVANYTQKGSQAAVHGRIQTRNYENDQGQRIYVTEVVANSVKFLSSSRDGNNNGGQQGGQQRNNQNNNRNQQGYSGNQNNPYGNGGYSNQEDPFANDGPPIDISDDDLPF